MCMGLSLSKFEGVSPKKYSNTLHSFFGRKPNTAKQAGDQSAELGEASCSVSKVQIANGADVSAVKHDGTPTKLPSAGGFLTSAVPSATRVGALTTEAADPTITENPVEHGGSSHALGGDPLVIVSGMAVKQEPCLHSEINAEAESGINVTSAGDLSQLLDAAGMNQGIFHSLPSDIQGEIIRDLSVGISCSANEVGVVSCSVPRPCELCGIPVAQGEAQVHADYHMAQRLSVQDEDRSQDEGRSQATGTRSKESADGTSSANPRKRPPSGQCNSLNKYFKPSKH